jgi:hypothetical protein
MFMRYLVVLILLPHARGSPQTFDFTVLILCFCGGIITINILHACPGFLNVSLAEQKKDLSLPVPF